MSLDLDTGTDVCFPPTKTKPLISASYILFNISILSILFAHFIGHAGSGIPRNQLGKRASGYGLFPSLYNHLIRGVGAKGYDSSLGSFSPSIQLLFHISCYVFSWSIYLYLWALSQSFRYPPNTCLLSKQRGVMAQIQDAGIASLCLFILGRWAFYRFRKGVSDPGGPREHKIRRVPRWDTRVSYLDGGKVRWRCAVAEDSHRVTHRRFHLLTGEARSRGHLPISGSDVPVVRKGLSGEPVGRQIWTCGDVEEFYEESKSSYVDDVVVENMASGGRDKGFDPSVNPNSCDKLFRAQQIRAYLATGKSPPDQKWQPSKPSEAAQKAAHFYSMLQTEDGHWAGDYGGPHFLMPGVIISWYVMGQPSAMLDSEQCAMMRHYLTVHQQSDGGWGTHIESPSTMFGTVLCYVSLRLLGFPKDNPSCVKGREFIQSNGGAVMTSSWAKLWLCILGCMEWEGHNSVPPEMWLLPSWFPFHPSRMWCHARMVYLPMGYLYGVRFVYDRASQDPIVLSLRKELYNQAYDSIPWSATRHHVAPMDNYSPLPFLMKIIQDLLALYESFFLIQPFKNIIRKFGLQFCMEYMVAEDLQTNYIDIGPVNKVMNLLSAYHDANKDLKNPAVQNHIMRIADYLWIAEDGMKMQGYNGSQCWDTSFAIQAMYEAKLMDVFPNVSCKVWSYLERTQILSTPASKASNAFIFESSANRNRFYRHVSEGGWPFSTSAHGWPISDCTGEGLKGVLALLKCKCVKEGLAKDTLSPISDQRLFNAVNVILTLQNEDGGWATYENNRGYGWYEQLNPSEVFGDIMIDYSYVECSMASLTALHDFQQVYPSHRSYEIKQAIDLGRQFIKSIQRPDGSWYGSWACCFCYAAWFGIEGLVAASEPLHSPCIKSACEFLLLHQRPNGGWGEDFTSCYDKDYASDGMRDYGDDGSGVVNTAWALLALAAAKCDNERAIARGVKYLMQRQLPTGDWPQEGIAGVFNRACGITYTAYRNVFPMWALGRCTAVYGDHILDKLR